jgi:uracil-DNA glycosylase
MGEEITLINEPYGWEYMTLVQLFDEGNCPDGWEDFFSIDGVAKEIQDISEHLSVCKKIIYPQIEHLFRAFIPLDQIKVCILGMDPYHSGTTPTDGSATGICFQVKKGTQRSTNPSLKNIYKEIGDEKADISTWSKKGCLMINTALTVEKGKAGSHTRIWRKFTTLLIEYVSEHVNGITFLLMGRKAQKFKEHIKGKNHVFIETSHPSPFSAYYGKNAFIGSGCFKKLSKIFIP